MKHNTYSLVMLGIHVNFITTSMHVTYNNSATLRLGSFTTVFFEANIHIVLHDALHFDQDRQADHIDHHHADHIALQADHIDHQADPIYHQTDPIDDQADPVDHQADPVDHHTDHHRHHLQDTPGRRLHGDCPMADTHTSVVVSAGTGILPTTPSGHRLAARATGTEDAALPSTTFDKGSGAGAR